MGPFLMRVMILLAAATLARGAEPATQPGGLVLPSSQVTIPLLRADDHLLVPVSINGQDAGLFIVDTGASRIIIDSKLAQRLNLPKIGAASASMIGGPTSTTMHPIEVLRVGETSLHRTFAVTADISRFAEATSRSITGLLGTPFLRNVPFRISHAEATLTLYDRQKFLAPASPRFELRLLNSCPLVFVTIENDMSGWFQVDAGSDDSLTFSSTYARFHRNELLHRPWIRSLSLGLGGPVDARSIMLSSVELLGSRIDSIRADYSLQTGGTTSESEAGMLGNELLRNFDLTFDYEAGAIWATHRPKAIPAEWERDGFDPKASDLAGVTPLMRAADLARADYVSKFLKAGVDVNVHTQVTGTALHRALHGGGDIEVVKLLLAAGADVNLAVGGTVPLHTATRKGSPEAVNALIAAGAKLNPIDGFGRTPLIIAAERGQAEMVRTLIRAGADVKVLSASSGTALYAAATAGSAEIVTALLDAGADPNATTSRQTGAKSILGTAANNGRIDAMRLLIARGARVNGVDDFGQTALIGAAVSRNAEAVKVLLDAGADKTIRDKDGKNALDYVGANTEVMSLLYYGTTSSATRPREE